MNLRPATDEDADRLLTWRNDPVTRQWSRNTEPVARADHLVWLQRKLDSPESILLIAEEGRTVLGTVRFDQHTPLQWEVSITLAPEHRGRGHARRILLAAERRFRALCPEATEILATVHRKNTASRLLFSGAGYLTMHEGEFLQLSHRW